MQVGSSGVARILKLPGHRDCMLPKAVHREKFLPSFFLVTRMGSRGTFVLHTASNPCLVRLAGEPGTVIHLKLQGSSSIDRLYRISWNGIK